MVRGDAPYSPTYPFTLQYQPFRPWRWGQPAAERKLVPASLSFFSSFLRKSACIRICKFLLFLRPLKGALAWSEIKQGARCPARAWDPPPPVPPPIERATSRARRLSGAPSLEVLGGVSPKRLRGATWRTGAGIDSAAASQGRWAGASHIAGRCVFKDSAGSVATSVRTGGIEERRHHGEGPFRVRAHHQPCAAAHP